MSKYISRRPALIAGGFALATMGVLAAGHASADGRMPATSEVPQAPGDPVATTETASPSVAPAHPIDCTDPNNTINCQTPPLDSPMVSGTAEPGSPYRD